MHWPSDTPCGQYFRFASRCWRPAEHVVVEEVHLLLYFSLLDISDCSGVVQGCGTALLTTLITQLMKLKQHLNILISSAKLDM